MYATATNYNDLTSFEKDNYFRVAISVNSVIFGINEHELKVLLIRSNTGKDKNKLSLLSGLLLPDEDTNEAASRVVKSYSGLTGINLQQVQTPGFPHQLFEGKVVSIAYYSLINIKKYKPQSEEEFELLWYPVKNIFQLINDHQQLLNTALSQLQENILNHPIGFYLLPSKFSLRKLQSVYEIILSKPLDRRNFRKKLLAMNILEDLSEMESGVHHRPGKLYRFKEFVPIEGK